MGRKPTDFKYEKKMMYRRENTLKAVNRISQTIVNEHGLEFEDCYRLAVMLNDLPNEKLYHLLFDFRDTRYSSARLKQIYKDNVLGITHFDNVVRGNF